MTLTITPTLLRGTIAPPASKSQAHRLLIGAALSKGESTLTHVSRSKDIDATADCMAALGATLHWEGDTLTVSGGNEPTGDVLDCGESGSTLRFLIPVALALRGEAEFRGHGRLMQRPQEPYFEIFRQKGISYDLSGDTLRLKGELKPGVFSLPGDVSSQFITGLLYALPLLKGASEIRLTTPLQSSGYVDMTLDALQKFGIAYAKTSFGYIVPGNQTYRPIVSAVEGDYSQAAFYCAAKGLGSDLTITGLNPQSVQGDRVILSFMEQLSVPGDVTLDVRECPDLVPPLALRACLRQGNTHITGAARLRIKESDRLSSVTDVLCKLGAGITEEPDGLMIRGVPDLSGGEVDSWNDHRIAMMAAIAATRCKTPVILHGAESVEKSYPTFFEDYAALGGKLS